ncbi:hypothetical protein D3C79_738120 [compost metagenome]
MWRGQIDGELQVHAQCTQGCHAHGIGDRTRSHIYFNQVERARRCDVIGRLDLIQIAFQAKGISLHVINHFCVVTTDHCCEQVRRAVVARRPDNRPGNVSVCLSKRSNRVRYMEIISHFGQRQVGWRGGAQGVAKFPVYSAG